MSWDAGDVALLLPLQPATFHILLALATDDRHGYGIMQEVEARTKGALRLSPGTLYSAIHRLLEQGLIVERRKAAGRTIDPRRRYYGITPFGTGVARAETRRLADLVRMAKGVGLLAPELS
jgi:DNA-binding PadR family transcriptional regulator